MRRTLRALDLMTMLAKSDLSVATHGNALAAAN
jgi:hypothetical protein